MKARTTFGETLDRHLRAIRERDLDALADTLAEDALVLVMADGRLVRSRREFLNLHRDWFAMPGWSLEATPESVWVSGDTGVAVLRLDYRETSAGKPLTRQESYLTLIFRKRGGRWRMVHDQNTPIRAREDAGA